MANLRADEHGYRFDQVVQESKQAWAKVLNKFTLEGGSDADKTMFYTSLYRTYIAPFVYQDVDGHYRGMDGKVHQAKPGFTNYSVYSMWDTFRAAHPLKTIIEKERSIDYVHDLLNKYKTGGIMPKWELHSDYTGEMVGYPAVSIIADVIVKYPDAFTPEEIKLALQAANVSANFDLELTKSWVPYQDPWNGDKRFTVMTRHGQYAEQHGYVPANVKYKPEEGGMAQDKYDELVNESVSYGVENAYYDWCIAQYWPAWLATNPRRTAIWPGRLPGAPILTTTRRNMANMARPALCAPKITMAAGSTITPPAPSIKTATPLHHHKTVTPTTAAVMTSSGPIGPSTGGRTLPKATPGSGAGLFPTISRGSKR